MNKPSNRSSRSVRRTNLRSGQMDLTCQSTLMMLVVRHGGLAMPTSHGACTGTRLRNSTASSAMATDHANEHRASRGSLRVLCYWTRASWSSVRRTYRHGTLMDAYVFQSLLTRPLYCSAQGALALHPHSPFQSFAARCSP